MQQTTMPLRVFGAATLAAGLSYLPLVLADGWQSAASIGTPRWWLVYSLATAHHVFLLFGLIGLYAGRLVRPGRSGLGAFLVASVGNLLVAGTGAIQLTLLPALAAHPEAAAGLDCTPFYPPATAAAEAFIEQACAPWQFTALEIWTTTAWLALLAGSVWLGIEVVRGSGRARYAGALLAGGWLITAVGLAAPLPAVGMTLAYLAIAAAYIRLGIELMRTTG